ncbi:MAG: Rieske (2Fe-2S) protein [Planctomycetes bacterium]|nr:Rieske (2Fe-2S) protein [Planctomycetota bacterium]
MENTAKHQAISPERRSFLGGLGRVMLIGGAATPLAGAFLSRPPSSLAPSSQDQWVPVLSAEELARPALKKAGAVKMVDLEIPRLDGWRVKNEKMRVFVVIDKELKPSVLSAVCPHLGCIVSHEKPKDAEGSFHCACHHAKFSQAGEVKDGPAPRAMDSLPSRVNMDGLQVQVQRYKLNLASKEQA